MRVFLLEFEVLVVVVVDHLYCLYEGIERLMVSDCSCYYHCCCSVFAIFPYLSVGAAEMTLPTDSVVS